MPFTQNTDHNRAHSKLLLVHRKLQNRRHSSRTNKERVNKYKRKQGTISYTWNKSKENNTKLPKKTKTMGEDSSRKNLINIRTNLVIIIIVVVIVIKWNIIKYNIIKHFGRMVCTQNPKFLKFIK